MADFNRPPGFKFSNGGMNSKELPDALPPAKFALLINVRNVGDLQMQTRPGYANYFPTAASPVTDLSTYAPLGTDDQPQVLAYTVADKVYSSSGLVATLATSGGIGWGSMLPFRPSASPQSWTYVTNGYDYQKISDPATALVQRVGIAEPGVGIDAVAKAPTFTSFNGTAVGWVAGGTASALADGGLFTDSVTVVAADPLLSTRRSLGVGSSYYTVGMILTIAATLYPVIEYWPAIGACTISAIQYYSGVAGRCLITTSKDISGQIGRGALIHIAAAEWVTVLSVLTGANGTCAFECITIGTYTAGAALAGINTVITYGATITPPAAVTIPAIQASIGTGTATLSQVLSPNPFATYTQDDYIYITLLINNIGSISALDVIFNIGTTAPDYATHVLTYSTTGAALGPLVLAGEIVQLTFPISVLDGSLQSCNGIQISFTSTNTGGGVAEVAGMWVGGGGSPDTGTDGAEYRYRIKPRSSTTGAQGNPSPDPRVSVVAHRQAVLVKTSTYTTTDAQVTLLDVYRYGGTLTSFRYVGTVAVGQDFTDNVFDDSAEAGQVLVTDDFEPWPTIDLPFSQTGGVAIAGTFITLTGMSPPPNIARWLPGTLVTLVGVGTFTLRARPTKLSGSSYLFETVELIGVTTATSFSVLEPDVADQSMWRIWGPDKYGSIFGVGDPLRPGTLYWAKPFSPDMASDQSTIELCPPSEPLLGGEILNDLPFVSSSARWWALYPNFSGTSPYVQVEIPVGRALVAPMASCTDGKVIYFWSKDGIYMHAGGAAQSITDADLYNLFPHEGVQASILPATFGFYLGVPDYNHTRTFRLACVNNYLFVDYQSTLGVRVTLVYDKRSGTWSLDSYAGQITTHYQPSQIAGPITSSLARIQMFLGDAAGNVWKEADSHNDNTVPIVGYVGTFEWDGGDARTQPLWGDIYLDLFPIAQGTVPGASGPGVVVYPLAKQALLSPAVLIPAATTRQFVVVSLGGEVQSKMLGLGIEWRDDFSLQSQPTVLYQWQPSMLQQPPITQTRFGDWANRIGEGT